jgi:enoyl-CoA hydratase/carnithine racemase
VSEPLLLVDEPAQHVRRLTLNRPDKRNALSNDLRTAVFDALEAADRDAGVRVIVLRGAGPCFSAGYDLSAEAGRQRPPYHTARGVGHWARHVAEGVFRVWDLATPVIAQVHGWCLAGGSELATACDLVYVAEDAQIGYPPVRGMSPPDTQFHPWLMGLRPAMEQMLTGDAMDGREAVRVGFANRAFPAGELEAAVLSVRRAGGQGRARRAADQQAQRPSRDGGHGPAHRDPARDRAAGAGDDDGGLEGDLRPFPDRRSQGAGCAGRRLRRLPNQAGLAGEQGRGEHRSPRPCTARLTRPTA